MIKLTGSKLGNGRQIGFWPIRQFHRGEFWLPQDRMSLDWEPRPLTHIVCWSNVGERDEGDRYHPNRRMIAGDPPPRRVLHRNGLLLLGVTIVCVFVVYVGLPPRVKMTVQDPGFEVLNWKFSTGPTHILYPVNQLLGKAKAWLKARWSVNLFRIPTLEARTGPGRKAFLVRFAGRHDNHELSSIYAEVLTREGIVLDLDCCSRYSGGGSFGACYILPPLPKEHGPYRLVLKRPESEKPVATWTFNRLD